VIGITTAWGDTRTRALLVRRLLATLGRQASAPHGLAVLLESRTPVKMFPLDSTQIRFDEVRRDRLFAYGSPASDALALLYHQWRLLNRRGQLTPTLFDAVPVVWMLQPSACTLTRLRISVDERGSPGRQPANRTSPSACPSMKTPHSA